VELLVLTPPDFIFRKADEVTPTYSEERNIPYGALTLVSFLREHGIRAMVAPLREFYQETGCFTHFDEGTPESRKVFEQKTSQILGNLLRRLHPGAIGLSVNFAIHQLAAEIIIDQIRALAPNLPVIIGGNHATHTAEHWLTRENPVDFVVLGEGEQTCLKLLQSEFKPGDLSGLARRRDDGSVEIGERPKRLTVAQISVPLNLELVALPRWAPLSSQKHWVGLSRGCNWNCAFCTSHSMWGRQRYRKPEAVASEIDRVVTAGAKRIIFSDDMLNPGSRRFQGLLEVLQGFRDCSFSTMIRMDLLERTDLKALAGANIDYVYLGVESFSVPVLEAMNKKARLVDKSAVESLMKRIKAAGMKTIMFMLIGHPGSNFEQDMNSARFCRKLVDLGLVSVVFPAHIAPFPGTAIAAMEQKGAFRVVETRMNRWTLWRPNIELLDSSGRVNYSAEEMQTVFDEYLDCWYEHGLGNSGVTG